MPRARKSGISKATGYKCRVFTAEYDLKGMVEAYGARFVIELVHMIKDGEPGIRDIVESFSPSDYSMDLLDDMFDDETGLLTS